jgi:hypothetical protein
MNETDEHLADISAILDAVPADAVLSSARLSAMAHRYLASSRECGGRIAPDALAELIRSELIGRFVHQGRNQDETQAMRMLAAALRRAQVDIEDRTHFIPCRLFESDGPTGLAVGPIVFQRTGAFRQTHAGAIATDPEFAALIERDFASWDWTAEVTVQGCDRIISRERALKATDGALDMLRLFAGADASCNLGRAGAPGLPAVIPAGRFNRAAAFDSRRRSRSRSRNRMDEACPWWRRPRLAGSRRPLPGTAHQSRPELAAGRPDSRGRFMVW